MNIFITLLSSILTGNVHCTWHDSVTDSDEQSGNGRPLLYNIRSMTEDYIPTLKGSDLDRYMKKLQCLCGRVGESSMLTLKTLDPYQFPSTNGLMTYFVAPCGVSKFVYVFY